MDPEKIKSEIKEGYGSVCLEAAFSTRTPPIGSLKAVVLRRILQLFLITLNPKEEMGLSFGQYESLQSLQ